MNKRKQQALETKQKLLDAADVLVREKGFDATSVDDIVAACGVSKGTFYHYFESKDDLLVYLSRAPYEVLRQHFAATEGKPWLERLELFMWDWFHIVEQYNLHFTVLHNRCFPAETVATLGSQKQSQIDEGMAIIQLCMRGAIENGELLESLPVETFGQGLIFSMQGSALYQSQNASSFDVDSWAHSFVPFVFHTLLKPYLK